MTTRILIAEDELHILTSLEFLMRQAGFAVISTQAGDAVLPLLARQRPQVLILDIMLPGMDGFQVCEQIRADETYAGLKIVLLTAKGRDADRERGLALGADLYITKPFSTRELVAQVQALLDGESQRG